MSHEHFNLETSSFNMRCRIHSSVTKEMCDDPDSPAVQRISKSLTGKSVGFGEKLLNEKSADDDERFEFCRSRLLKKHSSFRKDLMRVESLESSTALVRLRDGFSLVDSRTLDESK